MLKKVVKYIKEKYPDVSTDRIGIFDDLSEEEDDDERDTRDGGYYRYHRQREREERVRYEARQVLERRLKDQVANDNAGFGYQLCDMDRLKRFLTLGSEFNTYYVSAKKIELDSVECVNRLIANNKYQQMLDLVDNYNKEGRVAKDDPLLLVLAICATHERLEVRKAAYEKVKSICNIPTKLFSFIDMTHEDIVKKRLANPPQPQPYVGAKRKLKNAEKEMAQLKIKENMLAQGIEEPREPTENYDETQTQAEVEAETEAAQAEEEANTAEGEP